MNESERIAELLRQAFQDEPWHGPSLLDALSGVTAEMAAAHPVDGAHSIWELVEHLHAWMDEAAQTVRGRDMKA